MAPFVLDLVLWLTGVLFRIMLGEAIRPLARGRN